jgi:predicted DNA-binding transcriptional regulator YafY
MPADDSAPRRRRSMPDHREARRRLAILRRLQAGPATWRELAEAVGPISYGIAAGDVSALNGNETVIRLSVNRDVAWLRRVGCRIRFQRTGPGEGGQYVLEGGVPAEMAAPLRLDPAQLLALDFLEREWAGQEGPAAEAVRSLLGRIRAVSGGHPPADG